MYATTEITSPELTSDNPIHQRLLMPYHQVSPLLSGHLLEVGVGVGRGLEILGQNCTHYTGLDKNQPLIRQLQQSHPQHRFLAQNIPPFTGLESNAFDFVVSFQVIEHIQDDEAFVKEIHRVLKPGGQVILTTPNRKRSLSRNPWHVREYFAGELIALLRKYFPVVNPQGIAGSEKVEHYLAANRASVQKIMRWDVFNLQYRLPRWALQIPYEVLNRLNRNRLQQSDDQLVREIDHTDYTLSDDLDNCLDFYFIAQKAS